MSYEIWIKGALCLLAVPVVLWLDRARRSRARPLGRGAGQPARSPRRASGLLVLLAVVAAGAWYNFGAFHAPGWIHHWEQFHYVLGSKYFPELGYDGLYAASVIAQRETPAAARLQPTVRDLRTNQVVPVSRVLEHGEEVKKRFTPERWEAFCRDNAYFLDDLQWGYLGGIRKDHGYNPPPSWTFVARLVDGFLPRRGRTLGVYGVLDVALLVLLFAFLVTTYGSRIGSLCLIVFGLGYSVALLLDRRRLPAPRLAGRARHRRVPDAPRALPLGRPADRLRRHGAHLPVRRAARAGGSRRARDGAQGGPLLGVEARPGGGAGHRPAGRRRRLHRARLRRLAASSPPTSRSTRAPG